MLSKRDGSAGTCSSSALHKQWSLISILPVYLLLSVTFAIVNIRYSQHALTNIGSVHSNCVFDKKHPDDNILAEQVRPSPWIIVQAGRQHYGHQGDMAQPDDPRGGY